MKKMAKKAAKDLVERFMPQTGYRDDKWVCRRDDMEQMLRGMGFGHAETQTIIGALVLAGAQIYEEVAL